MRAIEWLARTTMLVLAALATLALIGALASVSNSPVAGSFPGAIDRPGDDLLASSTMPVPTGLGEGAPERDTSRPDPQATSASRRIEAEREREVARWLKALTYAVIALVAVAAAGVIALVRIGGAIARAAER